MAKRVTNENTADIARAYAEFRAEHPEPGQ